MERHATMPLLAMLLFAGCAASENPAADAEVALDAAEADIAQQFVSA